MDFYIVIDRFKNVIFLLYLGTYQNSQDRKISKRDFRRLLKKMTKMGLRTSDNSI